MIPSDTLPWPCTHGPFILPYVAGCLDEQTQTRFEQHLYACDCCSRAVEFELRVKRTMADFAKFAEISRSWH